MTYSPWVPTSIERYSNGSKVTAILTTDLASHLYLATSIYAPAKSPRQIQRRGATVICGFSLNYASPTCAEQAEPGDTTTHTFEAPEPPTNTPLFGTFTATCPPRLNSQTTVPIDLMGNLPPTELPALGLQQYGLPPLSPGHELTPTWDTLNFESGWPPPWAGSGTFTPPVPTGYEIHTIIYGATTGPTTIQRNIQDLTTGDTIDTQSQNVPSAEPIDITLSYFAALPKGHTIASTWINHGPGTFIFSTPPTQAAELDIFSLNL